MATNNVTCPECGIILVLVPKQGNPKRLVGFCRCGSSGYRQVYETDAPNYPPSTVEERINQSEFAFDKKVIRRK
jgi:hypothetical protein